MPAIIRVTLKTSPTGVPIGPMTEGTSRNDLRKGYEVTCTSVHSAVSYSWQLSFTPETSGPEAAAPDADAYTREDSTANLTSTVTQQTKFTVDNEGAYLIRLVTDAGEATEDVQFVRLRVKTTFAELFLISAGERRDESGTIPADVSAQGWANEQNSNLQRLMLLVRRASMSGRVLYVDHNRGRSYTSPIEPNDPTNIVRMPGPETGREDETGMRIACEGFADFSSINLAITYAENCVSRGEAPLDEFNPYIIKIAPGAYQEDLRLIPHVHLIADTPGEVVVTEPNPGQMIGVAIFPTTNPGAHHFFTGTNPGDFVVLRGIELLNFAPSTEPVLRHIGGLMLFDRCNVVQTGAATGAIVSEANGALPPQIFFRDSFVYAQVDDPTNYAVTMTDIGVIYGLRSNIWGDSGVRYNTNFQDDPDGAEVRFEQSWVRAMAVNGYAFRGLPGIFYGTNCEFDGEETSVNPLLAFELADTSGVLAGVGAVSYDVQIFLNNTRVEEDISVRTKQTSNTVGFYPSSIRFGGDYIFPTGAPDEWEPLTRGESLLYDNAYVDPVDPVGGVPGLLPTNKVQNAIDMLVGAALPLGTSPYYSLDSAYDGLDSLQPLTYGDGAGRTITADAGAVQIGGAETPVEDWLEDEVLTGGLQVEGNVDIGPFVSGAPNGALDNLGSEINLRPGTYAGAASMSLGRSVVSNDFAASGTHRGLPAGLIMGGNPNAMNATDGHAPFNLHLRTRNNYESDTDELGRIVLGGGESYPDFGSVGSGDTLGGSVYVQGGTCYQPSGAAPFPALGGTIFLAPGMATNLADSTASTIRVCLLDNTISWASLDAANPFVAGGSGVFYVGGLNGVERFLVDAADDLNALVTRINLSSYQFVASNQGGALRLRSLTPGPNGDVLFIASEPPTLNTANLGELRVASGATFTPGDYNKYVDIGCTDTDELTIFGDLHATGDITAGGSCCGGGGGGPTLVYQKIDCTLLPPPPFAVPVTATARLVGMFNPVALPGYAVVLPTPPPPGREVTIKDESLNAGLAPFAILPGGPETIDGAPVVMVAVNGQAIRLYSDGLNWFIC